LLKFGPVGEELTPSAEDVIAYLDSIIEDPKFEFFLLEFIERLDSTRRARLLELLSR
jgi:glycosylphosphatidylinositol transamidase (GPIT) subunit GPI8